MMIIYAPKYLIAKPPFSHSFVNFSLNEFAFSLRELVKLYK